MKPQQLESGLASLDALSGTEAVCCFMTEDERPLPGATGFLDWRLCGELSRILKTGFFTGVPGEALLLPGSGRVPARRIFAVGLGKAAKVTAGGVGHALEKAADMLSKAQVNSVALAFPPLSKDVARDALIEKHFAAKFQGAVAVFSP